MNTVSTTTPTVNMTELKNKAIATFKEWAEGHETFKVEKYNFSHTHDGFSITSKGCNTITKQEVDVIDEYCHITANFTWTIFQMPIRSKVTAPSFEIQCFY